MGATPRTSHVSSRSSRPSYDGLARKKADGGALVASLSSSLETRGLIYGEGISFALGYGEAEADAIAAAFDRGRFDFADYAKRVRRHPLLGQLPVRARVARLGKHVNDPRAFAFLWSLGSRALQYTRWNDGSYVPAADAHWLLRA